MTNSILSERTSTGIGLQTINRPQLRNALSWEAMEAFATAVAGAESDSHLRALIVTNSGGSICSGGDPYGLDPFSSRLDGARLTSVMGEAIKTPESLPFATIAAIDGPPLGGGAEVALACDLRIMAEGASLGYMHVRLGITPA